MFLPSILAFLAPLAIYCWGLADINRRSKPTVVSGVWDCAVMLLAAGGILLMVGPFLLHHLFWRIMDTLPPEEDTETGFDLVMRQWWFFWVLYFMVLLLAVFLLLWWRRSKTEVIYNVDPEMFGHVLHDCLEEPGVERAPARATGCSSSRNLRTENKPRPFSPERARPSGS